MRKAIGVVLILLFVILVTRFIYNYKAIFETIGSIFLIVVGKSQLEDKTAMIFYFLGIVLEFVIAFVLLFFGIRKASK